jgi:5-methyltetrahydrofolate corrinoid/iron sulfur protein methyltransferase
MIIVGELINSTRKSVKEAIESSDGETIQKLAADQAAAGASYIDVNAGIFIGTEIEHLKWVIDQVTAAAKIPCCIDSSNPKTIEAALSHLQSRTDAIPMINSISLETERCEKMMPILAGTDLKVIALCMGDEGMPETADQRLAIADRLINRLVQSNVKLENIYVDPLVQALATNSRYGIEFLKAVEAIMAGYPGVHTMCGLSNISFGMPARKFVNQTLMVMAIAKGLDGAIMNPLDKKMMANICTAEAIAGKDNYCMNYLKSFRAGMIEG